MCARGAGAAKRDFFRCCSGHFRLCAFSQQAALLVICLAGRRTLSFALNTSTVRVNVLLLSRLSALGAPPTSRLARTSPCYSQRSYAFGAAATRRSTRRRHQHGGSCSCCSRRHPLELRQYRAQRRHALIIAIIIISKHGAATARWQSFRTPTTVTNSMSTRRLRWRFWYWYLPLTQWRSATCRR